MRQNGQRADALRPVSIMPNYLEYADGSALIICGHTRVLCAATIEETVPPWLRGRGRGWVTAEYAMLPRSTLERTRRETRGLSGRTQEIRRLIGRSLRASVDMELLGERMIIIDCDVIQADGGTRTAAITGGQVALELALGRLVTGGLVDARVLGASVAAVSVGIVQGRPLLDLCYREDSAAEVDLNVVMNEQGDYIEVQGTAEERPFSRERLNELLDLADGGIRQLLAVQKLAVMRALDENKEEHDEPNA